jgi:hypothetical protein
MMIESSQPPFCQTDVSGRRLSPTQNVELLVSPFGEYEVEAVDESSVYLVDSCGGIFCNGSQVRVLDAYR